jgi:hypothetical protein
MPMLLRGPDDVSVGHLLPTPRQGRVRLELLSEHGSVIGHGEATAEIVA